MFLFKLGFYFTLIFYFNCEHILFVYFIKQNFVDFQNLQNSNFVRGKFLKIQLSIGSYEVPQKKLGPIGSAVLTFLIQTNTQTSKVYICFFP